MRKRIFATFLALFIVLGVLPPGMAWAADGDSSGETVIHVSHPSSILRSLFVEGKRLSNVRLVLEGKNYVIGQSIQLQGFENITIEGAPGTQILCDSSTDTVFSIWNCKGITLKNIIWGHEVLPNKPDCSRGVIQITNSDATIIDCDIFGCGLDGISSDSSNITVRDTAVHDCSRRIMEFSGGKSLFQHCVFYGNGYKNPSQYGVETNNYGHEDDSTVTFFNCTFVDNENKYFYGGWGADTVTVTSDNCTFYNNAWGDNNVSVRPEIPVVTYNNCGSDMTWTFENETLAVSGVGTMWDYSTNDVTRASWYSIRPEIKMVTIEPGVTSIGESAFNKCSNLTSVTLPSTLESIGNWAFMDCLKLADVYYAGSEEQWNAIDKGYYGSKELRNATMHYNSTGPEEPPVDKPGDLDGDGKVTMMDVMRLARAATDPESLTAQQLKLGDLDGDGKITMIDVMQAARSAAG